ncbi:hypothetical protein K0M31_016102, partial [Melipona bicolor]
ILCEISFIIHVRESFHASIPTVWVQARTQKIYCFARTLSSPCLPKHWSHGWTSSRKTRHSIVD